MEDVPKGFHPKNVFLRSKEGEVAESMLELFLQMLATGGTNAEEVGETLLLMTGEEKYEMLLLITAQMRISRRAEQDHVVVQLEGSRSIHTFDQRLAALMDEGRIMPSNTAMAIVKSVVMTASGAVRLVIASARDMGLEDGSMVARSAIYKRALQVGLVELPAEAILVFLALRQDRVLPRHLAFATSPIMKRDDTPLIYDLESQGSVRYFEAKPGCGDGLWLLDHKWLWAVAEPARALDAQP